MSREREYEVTDLTPAFDIQCTMVHEMLPMRDGVRLHTAIYFPKDFKEKAPVILMRNPYTRTTWFEPPMRFCSENGLIYVTQACRGTGWSEGVFEPSISHRDVEMRDAEDLFAWLEKQPWFDGRCGMVGASYPGWTQWCAARTGWKPLLGILPGVAPLYGCLTASAPGGGMGLDFSVNWVLSMHHRRNFGYAGVPDYRKEGCMEHLPVMDVDNYMGYPALPHLREWFTSSRRPHSTLTAHRGDFSQMSAAAYISGGWFDGFVMQTIESFQLLRANGATERARKFSRLRVGPWAHGGPVDPSYFGTDVTYDRKNKEQEHFLLGLLKNAEEDPLPDVAPVNYYLLGANQWKTAEEWPPRGVAKREFYLHSAGNANSSQGDGVLSREAPAGAETSDCTVSDPNRPVSSAGTGTTLLDALDFSQQERRSDVLVYTSAPLQETVTVTGEVRFRFFASCSTADTDFFATLLMEQPDGRAIIISKGMVRARFRDGTDEERFVTPGEVVEYEIRMNDIAVQFQEGQVIRLAVHGQFFPALDRNANSGGPIGEDVVLHSSVHRIFHDAEHPSRLIFDEL